MEEIRSLQGVPDQKSSKNREVIKVGPCDTEPVKVIRIADYVIEFSDGKFKGWPDARESHEEERLRKWEVKNLEEP
jgi:hypothetical protein